MLVINKNCTYYTIASMTVDGWLNKRKLSNMGDDIATAIDDDNELFREL